MRRKSIAGKMGLFITIALFAVGKQESLSELILPEGQSFFNHDWSLKYFFAFYFGALAFNRIRSDSSAAFPTRKARSPHRLWTNGLPPHLRDLLSVERESNCNPMGHRSHLCPARRRKNGPRVILENKLILHIGKVSFSICIATYAAPSFNDASARSQLPSSPRVHSIPNNSHRSIVTYV